MPEGGCKPRLDSDWWGGGGGGAGRPHFPGRLQESGHQHKMEGLFMSAHRKAFLDSTGQVSAPPERLWPVGLSYYLTQYYLAQFFMSLSCSG